ncbi:MAG: polysaccharide deacetylase family protein, partial [Thermoplasmata archaeon]|nr:polysaccharide deacetylase family protein [Thermoplasmata archaeon]
GDALDRHPEFRVSLSITGTWIEQAQSFAPDVVERVRRLIRSGRVALVGETYYHSLAFLLPSPELAEEVAQHRAALHDTFGADPKVLRMTELAYSDELAK